MYVQPLDGEWQVSGNGVTECPAIVPGSIHVDLMAAGIIPDPFVGDNEGRVSWVAGADWIYHRTFTPDPNLRSHDAVFLECKGLDTLATIRLNGVEVARTDNMHRRYAFDVTECVAPGENVIEVEFSSPVNHVKKMIGQGLVISPGDSIPGAPYLRKSMYQWGWDWAPKLPTSGIWRSIRLVGRSTAKLADVSVRQVHGRTRAELSVSVQIDRLSDGDVTVFARLISPEGETLEQSETLPIYTSTAFLDFLVEAPALWWPNGYGDAPLYELQIEVHPTANKLCVLDYRAMRIGLRSLELRQTPDEWGSTFMFVVNGVPIFSKGANWIPADQFPTRVTGEQYRDLVYSAVQANMNMLRVWGGGIYEDDLFYELCDEFGILVWQDFMFACARYPANPEMLENIRLEAVDNIRRIRHHPCLALWCGNNEMEWLADAQNDEIRKNYDAIFHELLPAVCAEEDADTPYWPSSPSSGTPFVDPNGERAGDGHYWDVWHGKKPFTDYREHYFRFMSEFGFESLPSMDTVKSFAEQKDWNMTSHVMESHQKNSAGNGLILYYLAHTFRFPKNFAMMVYVSQVLQAEAMRYGIEHWRRNRNEYHCMGTLYWQYNDCWPVASWAGVEYNHHWKALQYYAKRFYAPVHISAAETADAVALHVTNDRLESFQGTVRWALERLDGKVLDSGEATVDVPAASDVCVADLDFSDRLDDDMRREVVLAYGLLRDGERIDLGLVSFVPSKHLELLDPVISVEVESRDGAVSISLAAQHTARFVMLDVPGTNVRFSDNFFDLPAGRMVTVTVQPPYELSTAEIADRLRIVSLKDTY